MKNQERNSQQDHFEDNLSQLICEENLPPVLDELSKERIFESLVEKQASLKKKNAKGVSKWPLLMTGAAAAMIALLGFLFLIKKPQSVKWGNGEEVPILTTDVIISPEKVEERRYEVNEKPKRIELRDGSVTIAEKGTRFVEVAPRQLELESGSLYLMVAKADAPLEVLTAQGKALALGTRFLVTSEKSDTKVSVAQGRVKLVNAVEEEVELVRGEEGVLTRNRVTRQAAQRLSHLVSWARDAMHADEEWRLLERSRTGLLAVDPQGQETRLSLRKYVVDVFIENGVARTTIDQTFFNHYHSNTEGTFYFPLPPGAAVSRLAMYVNGVRNEGGMVERHRGQEIYNDIKYENRDPALLEQLEGNLYKLRIFPLEGRQEKRLFLSFTQSVDELYQTLRYWLPMDHTQNAAGKVEIKVRIKNGEALYEAKSSTHEFVKSVEEGDMVLSYQAENEKPDQDLLLKLIPKEEDLDWVETAVLKGEEEKYLHARIRPKLKGLVKVEPRQWFILNDTSASRSQTELLAQAHIVERLLAEADDEDLVAMANFNIDTERLMEAPVSLRDEKASEAVQAMKQAVRIGGTNFAEGIKAMKDWIAESGASNPHLLYLGDGLATDGVLVTRELSALLDDELPFFGIAVGKKADLSFLREAADVTGGGVYLMNPNEDLNWRVFDLLASLNTPRLTNLSWELAEGVRAYGDRSTLAAGEALTLVMASEKDLPEEFILRGELEGEIWEKVVSLEPKQENATFIPRFWAQRHLEELLKEGEGHRAEIVRLSKKHYVATPFTSLIVLEDDAMYRKYKVEKGREDHWAAYPAPEKIEVVREPLRWYGGAWQIEKGESDEEVVLDPNTVEEVLQSLLQPHRPKLDLTNSPDQVRRFFYKGEDFYNLGLYDQAEEEFKKVLRVDPYSKAARRWLERCAAIKSDYFRAAYDHTRARLLNNVDGAWEIKGALGGSGGGGRFANDKVGARERGWTSLNRSKKLSLKVDRVDGLETSSFGRRVDFGHERHNGKDHFKRLTIDRLIDLIPALATSEEDRISAVEMKFGREKRGEVTVEAAELIRSAERQRKAVRLAEGIITPEGEIKGHAKVAVYLDEDTVTDGESWYHIYRELGFATKRPLTPTNRGVIQAKVPHWPPSLEELEARWIVTLVEEEEASFTIELVNPERESRKMLMVISDRGLLLEVSEWEGEKELSSREFQYEGESVIMTSDSGEELSYEAVEVEVTKALFSVDLDGLVVLDLPLRKAAYYEGKLAKLAKNDDAKREEWQRYTVLANLKRGVLTASSKQRNEALKWMRGSEAEFDHVFLSMAANTTKVSDVSCAFLRHYQDVKMRMTGYGLQLSTVEEFMKEWPDSPYLLSVVRNCYDPQVWVSLLEFPDYQKVAIERIVLPGILLSNEGRPDLVQRIGEILIADAKAGRPMVISRAVAHFLGREQVANQSWRKVVAAYEKLAEKLEERNGDAVLAILDVAMKEKNDTLVARCFAHLERVKDGPDEQAVLATIFASHGRHKEAVSLYRKVLAEMENPSLSLLQQAALSAKSLDEELSMSWQRRALKVLRAKEGVSDKEMLFREYSDLQKRALAVGDLAMAKDVTLEAYELLPSKHRIISQLASHFQKQGEVHESWRCLSSILDRNMKNAEATGVIAAWYDGLQMWQKAAARYAEAHDYDSAHPQWLVKRVNALYRVGDFQQADSLFRELVTTKWADQLRRLVPERIEQKLVDSQIEGLWHVGEPEDDWVDLHFDDEAWASRKMTFLSRSGEELRFWKEGFYTRQIFSLARLPRELILKISVKEVGCDIYLNGIFLNEILDMKKILSQRNGGAIRLPDNVKKMLRVGENVLAVKYWKRGERPRAAIDLVQEFGQPSEK